MVMDCQIQESEQELQSNKISTWMHLSRGLEEFLEKWLFIFPFWEPWLEMQVSICMSLKGSLFLVVPAWSSAEGS